MLNAPDNTIAFPATISPILTPWLVVGGNADDAFSAATGAWTAPITGVYEINWNAVALCGIALPYVRLFILVNSAQKFFTSGTGTLAAPANLNTSAIFALSKGDVVQVAAETIGGAGLVTFNTSVFPAVSPNVFNIKSLF